MAIRSPRFSWSEVDARVVTSSMFEAFMLRDVEGILQKQFHGGKRPQDRHAGQQESKISAERVKSVRDYYDMMSKTQGEILCGITKSLQAFCS